MNWQRRLSTDNVFRSELYWFPHQSVDRFIQYNDFSAGSLALSLKQLPYYSLLDLRNPLYLHNLCHPYLLVWLYLYTIKSIVKDSSLYHQSTTTYHYCSVFSSITSNTCLFFRNFCHFYYFFRFSPASKYQITSSTDLINAESLLGLRTIE